MSGYSKSFGGWTGKYDPRLYDNPEGKMADFDFGILKKTSKGLTNTAEAFVRSKLRHDSGPLDEALCRRDLVAHAFVVSPNCPDLFARPSLFWTALDKDVWKPDQHLAVAVTLWFPGVRPQHLAVRAAIGFAQARLADARRLCVQVAAHAPHRIGHSGDLHVHLVAAARAVESDSLGTFARDLLGDGGQTLLHTEWLGYLAALPPNQQLN
jgi:hypothetical protein